MPKKVKEGRCFSPAEVTSAAEVGAGLVIDARRGIHFQSNVNYAMVCGAEHQRLATFTGSVRSAAQRVVQVVSIKCPDLISIHVCSIAEPPPLNKLAPVNGSICVRGDKLCRNEPGERVVVAASAFSNAQAAQGAAIFAVRPLFVAFTGFWQHTFGAINKGRI